MTALISYREGRCVITVSNKVCSWQHPPLSIESKNWQPLCGQLMFKDKNPIDIGVGCICSCSHESLRSFFFQDWYEIGCHSQSDFHHCKTTITKEDIEKLC